jgi:3-dehydroquinate synthase II/3-amino-4-hydroxybenzoic acid synthase
MSSKTAPIWCDLTAAGDSFPELLTAVVQSPIEGVLVRPEQAAGLSLPPRVELCVLVRTPAEIAELGKDMQATVIASDAALIGAIASKRWRSGVFIEVTNAETMKRAVELTAVGTVVVSFKDSTNIPLELVIAEAQQRQARVVKVVTSNQDAIVASGVLERGPAAVMLAVTDLQQVSELAQAMLARDCVQLDLHEAEVLRTRSVGMGTRACVDTVSTFGADEGMLVGSTSGGGILVCAEVHFLPYMNLRPFRVNAGAIHMYAWGPGGRTPYLSDLGAGEPVLAVNTSGRARPVTVGRIKAEVRPLRLIECRAQDRTLNVFLQDDWHVRVFDAAGEVRNSTDIGVGDRLLCTLDRMGRHVGIPVTETIDEF